MDEMWRQVRQIFDSAIQCPPEERGKFVAEACGGDTTLQLEVESLLSSLEGSDSFLESAVLSNVPADETRNTRLEAGGFCGRYRIIEQIGEGGMGEVFLATDTDLDRKVALKLLTDRITADRNRAARFRQEAFATSALNHPNIVTIYEIGKWEGRDFIVTEFVEGATLRYLLEAGNLLTGQVVDIVMQTASALAAAHGAGIVHRDIKPENIIVRPDGLVKVLDFGIAKYRPPRAPHKAIVETEIGEVIGTVAYMSPEQARGLEIDPQTDVWSLGVILYEMLTGELPFKGETRSDRIAAILEREPEPLSNLGERTSGQFQKIVDRALAKDRKRRYADIAEMAEDLHLLSDLTTDKLPRPLLLPIRQARESVAQYLVAGVALVIVIAAVAGLWIYSSGTGRNSGENRRSIAVLPLQPINPAQRDELFEIGIADSLIQRLGVIKGFIVRPLSAVRGYANGEQEPAAAGREQQVDYVLASSYQIAGGRIRVTSQLINVESGHIEETYKSEKDISDIFAMQDAVANDISNILVARFAAASATPLAKRGTENEEAYRLYLQGLYFNDKRTVDDARMAIKAFEEAVRIDPNYARAWAGLALSSRSIANFGRQINIHEQNRISTEAVNRALELDPNLSEASSALCENKLVYEYDFEGAEAACKRAIELDPNSPLAHNTYARLLMGPLERFDEAIVEIRTAIDLDPTSIFHQIVYTAALTFSRRYDDAARQLERVAQRNPRNAVAYFWLVGGVAMEGNPDVTFERLTRFQKMAGTDAETISLFENAFRTAGWRGVLAEQARRDHDFTMYFPGGIYSQLGDKDRAMEYLERSYERREQWMAYLTVDPRLDPLREDPRFKEFVARVAQRR